MHCEMERQRTRPVIHRLLNKTLDISGSEINVSVIYTILSQLHFVKPEQAQEMKGSIQTQVTNNKTEG
ncbi:MAG: hypothetical protein ACLRXB_14615 [Escherichia coli]